MASGKQRDSFADSRPILDATRLTCWGWLDTKRNVRTLDPAKPTTAMLVSRLQGIPDLSQDFFFGLLKRRFRSERTAFNKYCVTFICAGKDIDHVDYEDYH